MPRRIEVVSVAFVRDGEVLTVRKRGTARFMLVGGKPEPGESAEEAARREVLEEVGFEPGVLHPMGEYVGPAANEPDTEIRSVTFRAELPGGVRPVACNEIAELRWQSVHGPLPEDLAPVLRDFVIPLLRAE
jgi:8-oxo-dGTP pyrophosphatase MutT (NUDIX family)